MLPCCLPFEELCPRHGKATYYAVCFPPDADGIAREKTSSLRRAAQLSPLDCPSSRGPFLSTLNQTFKPSLQKGSKVWMII